MVTGRILGASASAIHLWWARPDSRQFCSGTGRVFFHRNCQGLHTTLTCTFRLKVHSCLTIEALTSTRRRALVSDCPTLIVRVIFPAPPEDRIIFVGLTDALLA